MVSLFLTLIYFPSTVLKKIKNSKRSITTRILQDILEEEDHLSSSLEERKMEFNELEKQVHSSLLGEEDLVKKYASGVQGVLRKERQYQKERKMEVSDSELIFNKVWDLLVKKYGEENLIFPKNVSLALLISFFLGYNMICFGRSLSWEELPVVERER